MYQADFHLHSNHSFDSTASMANVCRYALAKEYSEICFTEHFSLDPNLPTYGHMNWKQYQSDIMQNRARFEGWLQIRKGIEICEPHLNLPGYQELFAAQQMDFILGSIHNVNGIKLRFLLRDCGRDAAYSAFFQETLTMVRTADIDAVAHLDLIKRYSGEAFTDQDMERHLSLLEKILQTMIDRKIALEINTLTLKNLKQTMPGENILQLYQKLGGTLITFGSDSHSGASLGEGFDSVKKTAIKCGLTTFCTYEQRKPKQRIIKKYPQNTLKI